MLLFWLFLKALQWICNMSCPCSGLTIKNAGPAPHDPQKLELVWDEPRGSVVAGDHSFFLFFCAELWVKVV